MLGAIPSEVSELERVEDRVSFVYLEKAVISRDANALTAVSEQGTMHIPVAGLLVLLLGPGTSVTHQAMQVLADSGVSIVWVGEEGVRYYAGGRPLARTSRFLEYQAAIVSHPRRRMAAARLMYEIRFPGEDLSGLSMQQLRGREGARVRKTYQDWSKQTGVEWAGRQYDPNNHMQGSPINRALSAANACLYGVTHAAVVSLGCAPGLGIVHTGNERSFIYDIADLYKAQVSIPVAFEATSRQNPWAAPNQIDRSLESEVRVMMRDAISSMKLLPQIIRDVKHILITCGGDDSAEVAAESPESASLSLWSPSGSVRAGENYSGRV